MNKELRYKVFRGAVAIMESFNKAVQESGGCGFSIETLENMSAAELLEILCTNDIGFVSKHAKEEKLNTNQYGWSGDRSYTSWSKNEDKLLRMDVDSFIKKIAMTHGRSYGAIMSRIRQKIILEQYEER